MKLLLGTLLALGAPALSQSLLVNAGAELGTTAGWTDPTGHGFDVSTGTVFSGGFSFHGGVFGPAGPYESRIQQVVDLSSWATQIDAGGMTLPFDGAGRSNEGGGLIDWGRIELEVLDGGGAVLASATTGNIGPTNTWVVVELEPELPVGSRAARLTLVATRLAGQSTDSYFDDLNLEAPSSPLGEVVCRGEVCPCANDDLHAGCANSGGAGGRLFPTGSASFAADDLAFTAYGVPADAFGILVVGDTTAPGFALGDGLLCLSGNLIRFGVQQADASGRILFGAGHGAIGGWTSGDTRSFQAWYRDPGGPCGGGSNLTHGVVVTFVP